MGYCFPHYFVLPMYSSASSYRFRPLGPEETLMEIWSLTRFPEGSEPARPTPPEPWECDDPRWPPIPAQDFSNLPEPAAGAARPRLRVHALVRAGRGRASPTSNGPSTASWPAFPTRSCSPHCRPINVNPLERPIVDIGF